MKRQGVIHVDREEGDQSHKKRQEGIWVWLLPRITSHCKCCMGCMQGVEVVVRGGVVEEEEGRKKEEVDKENYI